jgi:bifunctional DNase/RNase
MIKVEIDSVRVSLTNQQRIVILKEVDRERYLPIWIGLYEAEAITIALQDIQVARPQTHDLLNAVIKALSGRLLQIEVLSLSEDVFYGNLVIEAEGRQIHVDCRPSDALALAARTHVPILISEEVMEQAGIVPEEDMVAGSQEEQNDQISEEPDLEIYEDFLKNFNLDDLGSESEDDENDEDS